MGSRARRLAAFAVAGALYLAASATGAWAGPVPVRAFPLSAEGHPRAAPSVWDLANAPGGGAVGAIFDPSFGAGYFGAARFRPDGGLDRRFGLDGLTPPIGTIAGAGQTQGVAVEPDGSVVAVGYEGRETSDARPLVARFRADGKLDRSFNDEGVVVENPLAETGSVEAFGEAFHAVAVEPDGTILAVGATEERDLGVSDSAAAGIVVAYRPDGSLDTDFGENGHVLFTVRGTGAGGSQYLGLKSVAIEADGKIVVSGFARSALFVARLEPDGSPDPGFGGGDGQVTIAPVERYAGCYDLCWSAASAALLPDGRVLVLDSQFPEPPRLVRFLPGGALDPSFGKGGLVTLRRKHLFLPFDMADAGGRIVVTGWEEVGTRRESLAFGVQRYDESGALDRAFGAGGFGAGGFETRRIGNDAAAFAALARPDGDVWAAGGRAGRKPNALLLARSPAP